MSSDHIDFDQYDKAIIDALRKHPEGIRYSQLNKEVKIDEEIVTARTFNLHLKKLVNFAVVNRIKERPAKVFYKLYLTDREELSQKIRRKQ